MTYCSSLNEEYGMRACITWIGIYSISSSSNDALINKDRLDINKLINHTIHVYDSDLVWRMELIIEVKNSFCLRSEFLTLNAY